MSRHRSHRAPTVDGVRRASPRPQWADALTQQQGIAPGPCTCRGGRACGLRITAAHIVALPPRRYRAHPAVATRSRRGRPDRSGAFGHALDLASAALGLLRRYALRAGPTRARRQGRVPWSPCKGRCQKPAPPEAGGPLPGCPAPPPVLPWGPCGRGMFPPVASGGPAGGGG